MKRRKTDSKNNSAMVNEPQSEEVLERGKIESIGQEEVVAIEMDEDMNSLSVVQPSTSKE